MDADLLARGPALADDDLLASIIASGPFARLWEVSFLGAIDYVTEGARSTKRVRSRADHSLAVAALADFVADARGYSTDLRRHVVAAALLHDIGHSPLSHSVEPYFKERLGVGHHELGEQVIDGQAPGSEELAKQLRKSLDTQLIKRLIAGAALPEEGGDLFFSPINIDTIEGIWRCFVIANGKSPDLSRSAVARAAFIDDKGQEILDAFWHLKHRAYHEVIHSPKGLAADSFAIYYFQNIDLSPDIEFVRATEKDWQHKFGGLFSALASLGTFNSEFKSDLGNIKNYTARSYWIDAKAEGLARYRITKAAASLKVGEAHGWSERF